MKASGFGRVDFDVLSALCNFSSANPECLMFGTDSPLTRAAVQYQDSDFDLIAKATGFEQANRIYFANAVKFYRQESALGKKGDLPKAGLETLQLVINVFSDAVAYPLIIS